MKIAHTFLNSCLTSSDQNDVLAMFNPVFRSKQQKASTLQRYKPPERLALNSPVVFPCIPLVFCPPKNVFRFSGLTSHHTESPPLNPVTI
jgi:hypothetical protein